MKATQKQPKQPKQPKILSKITLANNRPNISRTTQEEILKSIKDLLKDNQDIKNIKISHFDFKYIVIDLGKYLKDEEDFLGILKNINKNMECSLMSYTYKTNEGMTEPRKYLYKYAYKPPNNPIIFINEDD